MTDRNLKKPHHHGNLRDALIQAGIALLTEGGKESLTLRRCAARAGVSHAAPAHHFDGVTGLRAAIAKEGFRRFRTSMLEAREAGVQTAKGRVKSICSGYLNFAIANPALFDLIFSFDAIVMLEQDLEQGSAHAYEVLREACAPFVPKGEYPVVIETQVWSLIHGYSQLYLSGRFGPVNPALDTRGPFEQVMALLDRIGH